MLKYFVFEYLILSVLRLTILYIDFDILLCQGTVLKSGFISWWVDLDYVFKLDTLWWIRQMYCLYVPLGIR